MPKRDAAWRREHPGDGSCVVIGDPRRLLALELFRVLLRKRSLYPAGAPLIDASSAKILAKTDRRKRRKPPPGPQACNH